MTDYILSGMLKKNKIAIISDSFPPFGEGGITSAHYNLYCLLKKNNYQVKVFTFGDNPLMTEKTDKIQDVIRNGISARLEKNIGNLVSIIFKIQRFIFKKTDTNLVSYQLRDIIKTNLGSFKINRKLRIYSPQIVIFPDKGVPVYSIKKIKGAKYIQFSHHNPIRFVKNPFFGLHSEYDAKLALKIEKKALRKIDYVICPSEYMKSIFLETFGTKIPLFVIPNTIDNEMISKIEKKSVHNEILLDNSYPLVYIPSGGSRYKGERYVFEIIRRLATIFNFKIGFYVSGGLSLSIKNELSVRTEYSKIIFAPSDINFETNIAYIKSCTVCVSPSLVENFSMAILEANFCNVPAIVFDVGGNKEIVMDDYNGYVVPYLDVESLIDRTVSVIKGYNKLNAFENINNKFSVNAVYEKYDYFLKKVME